MAGNIAIVGAGVGGLATAARLARRGYEVDVFEKLPRSGGRAHVIEDRGFKFDTGPSFVLMPDLFREIFSDLGCDIRDHLDLRSLAEHYRVFFHDGENFTVTGDRERTKAEIERFEKGGADGFERMLRRTEGFYRTIHPLLYRCFTPGDFADPRFWPLLGRLDAFSSYWSVARRYFRNERLCFIFTFEAMFMGVSPLEAPAFYSIITYTDHVQRIFHPMGGMYEIPRALERLARGFGARFHFDAEAEGIERAGRGARVRFRDGAFEASRVVVNADFAHAQADLLKRRLPKYRYSCSVYLVYLGLKKKVKGLAHHNLFFAKDLFGNLDQIFRDRIVPDDPSFYVHVPTVTDPSLAPEGKEILYLLIPVPNTEEAVPDVRSRAEALRRNALERIERVTGERIEEAIETEHAFYPDDFTARYNIRFGATFGLAHTLTQSAFLRPANFDRRIQGLYYVGASTQPGGGLPPVLAGSRIVTDLIQRRG